LHSLGDLDHPNCVINGWRSGFLFAIHRRIAGELKELTRMSYVVLQLL
jgi:hypothetical protein